MTLEVQRKIESREARIGVIGLGYVGLPVAAALAEQKFSVTGVERRADRVDAINSGKCPIVGIEPGLGELIAEGVASGRLCATTDPAALAACDVVLINVDTPVGADQRPHFVSLRAACRSLAKVMKPGVLVIVESTVSPGTCDRIVAPLLAEVSGRKLNEGFHLGHCPERVMPGRLLKNLRELSRVCGGSSPAASQAMIALYQTIVHADLDESDCVTAELTKTAENAYRDVNIAFANELAMICEAVGADFQRVRELVNKSPGRNVLFAGGGVGGHCIPKDPWLLVHGAAHVPGFVPRVTAAARETNERMPIHVAALVEDGLREVARDVAGSKIALLGFAYLENSDDTRNSPSAKLVSHLKDRGAEIVIHDPWVPGLQSDIDAALHGADAAVIMVAHDVYKSLDWGKLKRLMRSAVVVDARNVLEPHTARSAGLVFRSVGRVGVKRWA